MNNCGHLYLPLNINFPEDRGLHPLSNIEWWYSNGFLEGDKGSNFAVVASFFRFGEFPRYKGHFLIFSLIDLDNKVSRSYSLIDDKGIKNLLLYFPYALVYNPTSKRLKKFYCDLLKGELPDPHQRINDVSINENPLNLDYGDSSLTFFDPSTNDFRLCLNNDDIKIDLTFKPKKPVILVGETGKINRLYYYSVTRNHLKGKILHHGQVESFTGEGWFDHQWGRDYKLTFKIGWDWFGIILGDGRELLMNQFLNINKKKDFNPMANLIEKDGTLNFTRNVIYYPLEYWESSVTHALYPIRWGVLIPDFNMRIYLRPYFKNQEIPIPGHMQAIWEGACLATGEEYTKGDHQSKILSGKGFMELVGYANNSG